jgi:hypothetical protein
MRRGFFSSRRADPRARRARPCFGARSIRRTTTRRRQGCRPCPYVAGVLRQPELAAGQVMLLHPNAVNYRVRRIEQALALDLEDRDTRLALELACRLREATC